MRFTIRTQLLWTFPSTSLKSRWSFSMMRPFLKKSWIRLPAPNPSSWPISRPMPQMSLHMNTCTSISPNTTLGRHLKGNGRHVAWVQPLVISILFPYQEESTLPVHVAHGGQSVQVIMELRSYQGIEYQTFKPACLAQGLLED